MNSLLRHLMPREEDLAEGGGGSERVEALDDVDDDSVDVAGEYMERGRGECGVGTPSRHSRGLLHTYWSSRSDSLPVARPPPTLHLPAVSSSSILTQPRGPRRLASISQERSIFTYICCVHSYIYNKKYLFSYILYIV